MGRVRLPVPVRLGRGRRPDVMSADAPFALQIEVTSNCNLRCTMCPLTTGGTASGVAGPVDISDTNWQVLLDVAAKSGQVFVSGFGEPLTNERCLDLLTDLDVRGVRTTFVTNGIAITQGVADRLARLRSLVHINVSIDSPDPDVYRQLRGGSLDRAWWGLRNLVAAYDDPGCISVSSVAMSANLPTLRDFPQRLSELGVRHYILQGLFDYNEFSQSQHVGPTDELVDAMSALRAACAEHGVDLVLAMPERTELEVVDPAQAAAAFFSEHVGQFHETRQCMLPWELPYIDARGDVYSCCYAASAGSEPLGRTGPAGLDPVWDGESYRAFRSDLVDGRTMPDVCRSCTAVPVGPHPLSRFNAELVGRVSVRRDGRVVVRARNTGNETWGTGVDVCVGTVGPRDGASGYWHPAWRHPARPVAVDRQVAPGGTHTFEFWLHPDPDTASQSFALVAQGVCWIPGTAFTVEWSPPS